MTTALATQTADHPAVLAGLAPAGRSEKELELAARFANLSDEKIARREKRYDILSTNGFVVALASPVVAGVSLMALGAGVVAVVAGMVSVGGVLLGGTFLSARRGINYANARKLREIRAKEDREAQLIADLDERFAVKLSPNELSRLRYPQESPRFDETIRYGTIDRMIQDPEGEGTRLEQLTLVWSNGEFHLLRQSNAFGTIGNSELS